MREKKLLLAVAAMSLLSTRAYVARATPTPIWNFNFNDVSDGVSADNSGSDPNAASATLTMENATNTLTPANHRVAGGPSGYPDDMAFSSVPSGGGTPFAVVSGANDGGISDFNQITLCGWYNISQPLPTGAASGYTRYFLIGNRPSWSEGMVVDFNAQGGNSNQLGLEVNDYYSPHYGGDAYWPVSNTPGIWNFWALTYDGTQQTGNVKLYLGTSTGSVTYIGSNSIGHNVTTNPNGTIYNGGGNFVLSADEDNAYTGNFVGLQDDIGVYSGVMTTSTLESIRESDLAGPSVSWVGSANSGTLDVANTKNVWNSTISPALQANDDFYNGDTLTFDDTASNFNVTINSTVSPASVTVNNSAHSYVFSGSGGISGTTGLTKTGTGSLLLSTSNSYSGTTNVSGGTLVVGAAGSLPAANPVVIGSGATMQLASHIGTVTTGSLTINGGTLDLTDNPVIVTYGAADPAATIASYLAAGYNGGTWNGTGIMSSTVATDNVQQSGLVYSVGFADGADGVVSGLNSGQIEILPTLAGDAKLQGNVVFGDYQLLAGNFGSSGGWDQGNFTYGSLVNFSDFQLLAQNFGANASGLTASETASLNGFASEFGAKLVANPDGIGFSVVSVPEPATVALLGAVGMGLLSRRRRK